MNRYKQPQTVIDELLRVVKRLVRAIDQEVAASGNDLDHPIIRAHAEISNEASALIEKIGERRE